MLLGLLLLGGCSRTQEPGTELESERERLGQRIAGSWLGRYTIEGSETAPTAFITTYLAGGSARTSPAAALGSGDPERHGLSSSHHIQWEPAGERAIRWRLLHFVHDARGNLTAISRTHGRTEFDAAFRECQGTFQVELYRPEGMLEPLAPNTPAEAPIAVANGTSRARRLLVADPALDGLE